ncbi:helicase [Rhodotorula toruloides]
MEGRGRRVHTCQWRNPQLRKNKSWESDGYVLVEGPAVTLYDDSGKHLGAKTLAAPPVEGDEFKVGQKDVLLDGQIPMSDFNAAVKATPTVAAATPARAVAGFLTRPGMLPSSSNPVASTSSAHTPRPVSVARSTAAAAIPSSSIETPVSAGKVWNEHKPRLQKPFKPLVPNSGVKRSPSIDTGARTGTPGPSRSREKAEQVRTKSIMADEEKETKPNGAVAYKGKARAKVVDSEEDDDENSPPKVDQPSLLPAKKRRKVDSVTTAQPVAPSKPAARLSAADAAFEMALSRQLCTEKRPPGRTVSLPARMSTSVTVPLKVNASAEDAPMDDVFLDHPIEQNELVEDLLEGVGDESWGDDLAEEEGEKPVVPVVGPSKVLERPPKPAEPTRAPGMPAESSGTRYFSCQWRKRSTKKRPVWEGDGILVVKGTKGELKDKEGGAHLTGGTVPATAKLDNGDQLQVGNMVVELEDPIDEQTYLDGGPYDDSWKSSVAPAPVLEPFRPPAPAKAVSPLATRVAARSASLVVEPHPSPHNTARFALPPAAVPSIAKFRSPALVKQPVVQATPLKEQAKKGGPRFDPEREGAVVMRRPDQQHQKQYNTKTLPVVDVVIDPTLCDKLRDHQKEGVAFMYEASRGRLGDVLTTIPLTPSGSGSV